VLKELVFQATVPCARVNLEENSKRTHPPCARSFPHGAGFNIYGRLTHGRIFRAKHTSVQTLHNGNVFCNKDCSKACARSGLKKSDPDPLWLRVWVSASQSTLAHESPLSGKKTRCVNRHLTCREWAKGNKCPTHHLPGRNLLQS